MIRVAIQGDVMTDGIAVGILQQNDGGRMLATGFGPHGFLEWQPVSAADVGTVKPPTMVLDNETARALMDELVRHYHGASDTLALRRDYDWVRMRHDKAVDALIELAARPQELHVHKATEGPA